ncbi:tripartite tricarboxylate transporter substrate binding protein [Alcaligenes sp. SDU_A2]|uniref:tripartite tricarboxylate transporter substrate binding protein n=1 Tax=Alcaligenes sp. SDU_A2 TaxID=3136634 RepID=UPI00311E077A
MLGAASASTAQYPDKPIEIIVTFPPGGGTDLLARLIGNYFSEELGQPAIVDNRPGASGNIGARLVAQRPADGQSLLMVNSSFAVNPAVFDKLPFDPKKDFTAITNFAFVPSVVIVPANSPYTSLKELIEAAKAKPGEVFFGSCGNGTPQHLAGEMLNQAAKVQIAHIPYKGCGGALNDVMGSQVGSAFVTASSTLPFIESGKVRALAVTSAQRSPLMPDVPTVAELGYPGYELNQWHGLLAPAGTPEPVIQKVHDAVEKIIARDDVKAKLASLGYTVAHDGPAQFQTMINTDIDRFRELAQKIGLKIN